MLRNLRERVHGDIVKVSLEGLCRCGLCDQIVAFAKDAS